MAKDTFMSGNSLRGVPNDSRTADPRSLLGRSITDGSFGSPIALLKRSAIENNARWMQSFVAHYGIQLAPHGKTSMAPKIFEMQLGGGSKWLSLANVTQAQVARTIDAKHILVANQVVNFHDLEYLARETSQGHFEAMCFVDSAAGVALIDEAMARYPRATPFPVLIEIGVSGGRAGVRDRQQALEVARAVAGSRFVTLAGLAGYEGVYSPKDPDCVPKVDAYLSGIVDLAKAINEEGLFPLEKIVLSAGGSKFFDRVAEVFSSAQLGRPVDVMIRCGCYLFHDVGIYEEALQLLYERNPFAKTLGVFVPAIEIWGQVQSRPEQARAIVDIGRRDVSYDAGLPVPYRWIHPSVSSDIRDLSGVRTARLNDQHCFLDLPEESALGVGDLVGFNISHPCTVFDKWHGMYLVDDDYTVLDFIESRFG
jgi:D-serine dehydratase